MYVPAKRLLRSAVCEYLSHGLDYRDRPITKPSHRRWHLLMRHSSSTWIHTMPLVLSLFFLQQNRQLRRRANQLMVAGRGGVATRKVTWEAFWTAMQVPGIVCREWQQGSGGLECIRSSLEEEGKVKKKKKKIKNQKIIKYKIPIIIVPAPSSQGCIAAARRASQLGKV